MTYPETNAIRNNFITSGALETLDKVKESFLNNSYSHEPTISKDLMTVANSASISTSSISIKAVYKKLGIRKIIFNDPATIVIWDDGEKTVVKTNDEKFSKEHGLAMAIAKRYFGTRSQFLKAVKNGSDKHAEAGEIESENS